MESSGRLFRDRQDAGRRLGAALACHADRDPVVLALPRGGVPVAYEVSRACGAPLDVCVARKVGVPWHPELGMGAVAEGGYVYLAEETIALLGVSDEEVQRAVEEQQREVEARVAQLRGGRPRVPLAGRTVIIVDDGIATGGTARAAIESVRSEHPARVVLAVPVAARESVQELAAVADDVVALSRPHQLRAIGLWYEDFEQVSEREVLRLLSLARPESSPPDPPRAAAATHLRASSGPHGSRIS